LLLACAHAGDRVGAACCHCFSAPRRCLLPAVRPPRRATATACCVEAGHDQIVVRTPDPRGAGRTFCVEARHYPQSCAGAGARLAGLEANTAKAAAAVTPGRKSTSAICSLLSYTFASVTGVGAHGLRCLVTAFPGRTGTRNVVRRFSILFRTTSIQLQHVPN
jgi:hypothetical protein